MDGKTNIFLIYASADKEAALHLIRRLKSFEDVNVSFWHNDPIFPNQPWKPQNESRLDQADVFLLMLSNAFMHSEFIQQLEFKMVIDRYKAGESTVIPFILDKCPWDINFESDDYNFSFKELEVFPRGGKPLSDWDSPTEAYNQIATYVKRVVSPVTENPVEEEPKENPTTATIKENNEDQLQLSFTEKAEAKQKADEEKLKKQAEAKRKAEEERVRQEEAKKKVAEEKSKQEAEIREKAIEDKKRQDDAEKKRIEEEKRLKQEAEVKRREQEEQKLQQEAEAKRISEAKRLAEAERLRKETEHQKRLEAEQRHRITEETVYPTSEGQDKDDSDLKDNQSSKRKILIGLLLAAVAIIAIFLFTRSGNDEGEEASPTMVSDSLKVEETTDTEQPEADDSEKENEETVLSKLAIGDTYDGGIVFDLDPSGKSGKIAHIDDAGPMPWQDAMIIHDQLGPGWRLPTLEELQTMYRNIGQASDNSGEFSDGLYWSATDHDEYQARLLRFRDGNTSYHYNKEIESRRFLVRAVKDFRR